MPVIPIVVGVAAAASTAAAVNSLVNTPGGGGGGGGYVPTYATATDYKYAQTLDNLEKLEDEKIEQQNDADLFATHARGSLYLGVGLLAAYIAFAGARSISK